MGSKESMEGLLFLEGIIIGLYGNWLISFLEKVSFEQFWHLVGVSVSITMFVAFFIVSIARPVRTNLLIKISIVAHFLATYGTLSSEYLINPAKRSTLNAFTFTGVFFMVFLAMVEYRRSSLYTKERIQRKSITERVFRLLGIEIYALIKDFILLTQSGEFFGLDRTRDIKQQLAEWDNKQLKQLKEEKIELNDLGKKFFSNRNSFRRFQETIRVLSDTETKYSEFLTNEIRLSLIRIQERLQTLIQLVLLRDSFWKEMPENDFFAKISTEIQSIAREADTMLTQEMGITAFGNVFYHSAE